MEFKFRRKGEVVTWSFPDYSMPQELMPPQGMEGIDLTAYSVIAAAFGRHGGDKATDLHRKAPSTIVIYKYEWRNGFGEGVLLPANFNSSRVRFYKPNSQIEAEEKDAEKKRLVQLIEQAKKAYPDMRFSFDTYCTKILVAPEQETFTTNYWEWDVAATTLQEIEEGIEKNRPLWKGWNDRALAILAARNVPNPGKGNLQIHFANFTSKKAGVRFADSSSARGCKWVHLEKQGEEWVEVGVYYNAP